MRINPKIEHLLGEIAWYEDIFDRERKSNPWEVDLVNDNPEETLWPKV